jgi:Derlin-2/3
VTRTYLAICTGFTLLLTLKLVSPQMLAYDFHSTFLQFNIWRPFTAMFFMGKFDFSFLFNIYFAYIALMKVETMVFTRDKYADFLWLNLLILLACTIVGSIITVYFFSEIYQMVMIYIWCKRFPHEEITLMFGFRVKSNHPLMQPATSPSYMES